MDSVRSRPLVIALAVLIVAAGGLAVASTPADAETVTGTFTYAKRLPDGTTTPRPIAFAQVEVWRFAPRIWPGIWAWGHDATATTNINGTMSIEMPFVESGVVYGVRVFATNYAAIVWPNDAAHLLPFHREPGEPGPIIRRTATAPTDVLDFTFTFADGFAPQHYNLAEVVRLAFNYATARRDARESDPIPPAAVQPTSVWGSGYNPFAQTVVINSAHTFEDFVIVHEYAHFLQAHISRFPWIASNHDGCQARNMVTGALINSPEHAWMEGFADYFAHAVDRSLPAGSLAGTLGVTTSNGTLRVARMEDPGLSCSAIGQVVVQAGDAVTSGVVTADWVEEIVAGSLWDLFDHESDAGAMLEAHDRLSRGDRVIFEIFDHELGALNRFPTLLDFYEAWVARGLDATGFDRILRRHRVPPAYLEEIRVRHGLEGGQQVAQTPDGRLEVFARGATDALLRDAQTYAGGTGWGGWTSMFNALSAEPAVLAHADGRLHVFVRGANLDVWHLWQTTPGGNWTTWRSLGGVITSAPVVAMNADGRLEVFARGTDDALWHTWEVTPGGNWSGWLSLGGELTSAPAVAVNWDGRLEVFARGSDWSLRHIWQVTAGAGWSGWDSLGGVITSAPVAAANWDGRLEVFARGSDRGLWHQWQVAPGGGWSGWASLGGSVASRLAAVRSGDDRLMVFARQENGTDRDALWSIAQAWAGGAWAPWERLGCAVASGPTATVNADGRVEVFVRSTDQALYSLSQDLGFGWGFVIDWAPLGAGGSTPGPCGTGPTGWSTWSSLGGFFASF